MGEMQNASCAAFLARTYLHTVTVYRPLAEGGEKRVFEALPCALSRSAHTSAPAPADPRAILPEAAYRYALYTPPDAPLALGDRLEVHDGLQIYRGRASDSFRYPTHCVTVAEILQVLPAGGQNSHETGGEGL